MLKNLLDKIIIFIRSKFFYSNDLRLLAIKRNQENAFHLLNELMTELQEYKNKDFVRTKEKPVQGEPSFSSPVSQLCTQSQFEEECFKEWSSFLKLDRVYHRKYWEWCFILQALSQTGKLREGSNGLGFAVGMEPLPEALASIGCKVLATDINPDDRSSLSWIKTKQHWSAFKNSKLRGICDLQRFSENVVFEYMDMKSIPDDKVGFDFVWSACALEHLGSIDNGLDFVLRSVDCLKPGGVAIHTTEFNVSSNDETLECGETVLFRKKDMLRLKEMLSEKGCLMCFNFSPGNGPFDLYVDFEPPSLPHLKWMVDKYVTTSIGLIIHKG